MNHLDCKLGWMKQQARIFASDSAWVTTAANVPSLKAWYRADTTVNAGGTVSQLTDKSGNGFHFVQATGTKQPALNVADANMGGRDSITFDGTDDALTLASPGLGTMSGCTLYFVTRAVPMVAGRIFSIGNTNIAQSLTVSPTSGSDARPTFTFTNPSGSLTARRVDVAANQAFYSTNSIAIWDASFDSGAAAAGAFSARSRLGEPSVSNSSSAATQASAVGQASAFAARPDGLSTYLRYTLAELIIADAVHSMDQRRKVELYLAGYYGLL